MIDEELVPSPGEPMILLIAIPIWILAVALIVGLCAASRRGDLELAMVLATHTGDIGERERLEPLRTAHGSHARRARTAESNVLSRRSSAAA
jgi:hypothetical protein